MKYGNNGGNISEFIQSYGNIQDNQNRQGLVSNENSYTDYRMENNRNGGIIR